MCAANVLAGDAGVCKDSEKNRKAGLNGRSKGGGAARTALYSMRLSCNSA